MSFKAFLVIWIDTTTKPPSIIDAGVYSEETPSSENLFKYRPQAILGVVSPNSFENARKHILALLNLPQHHWLHDMETIKYQRSGRDLPPPVLVGQTL